GDVVDNGQHVFLGCCTAYIELLGKLGQADKATLQDRLDVRIYDAEVGQAQQRARRLPAPLHLLPALLGLPYMTPVDKMRALMALVRMRMGDLPDDLTFAAWLTRDGQRRDTIRRFWDLIVVPTCNAPSDRVSARMAGFVFREGF